MSEEQICGNPTQVFSRVSGYYRPVQNWNDGKAQEFKERKTYDGNQAVEGEILGGVGQEISEATPVAQCDAGTVDIDIDLDGYVLFASKTCPNCKMAKLFLNKMDIPFKEVLSEDNKDLVDAFGLRTAPTLIKFDKGTVIDKIASYPDIRKYIASLPVDEEPCDDCNF